jgi:hypothetical protein
MKLGWIWGDVNWIFQEQVESCCEFGIEPSGSIKCWETIERAKTFGPLEWCSVQ